MLKVLFSAPNLSLREWCWSIGEELKRRENLEVKTYSYREYNTAILNPDEDILNIYNTFKPDLLFVIKGDRFKPETIRKIKCKKILVNDDDFQNIQENLIKEFDFVFTPTKIFLSKYKELGIKAEQIFFPVDTNIYKPLNLEKKWNVSFIGTFYKERSPYIEVLRSLPNFYLSGNGWLFNYLGHTFKIPRSSTEEAIRVLNESRIIFNNHQDIMKKVQASPNSRTQEVLACKQFLLTDYTGEQYENLKHLVIYKNVEEMKELITYYLEHPEEREKIAKQGHEFVKNHYTTKHFVNRVLEYGK